MRIAEKGHATNAIAVAAIDSLAQNGEKLVVVPQVLYEFWSVATRPTSANGLGRSPAEAVAEIASLRRHFSMLDELPAIFAEWERLVVANNVTGKNAHDARLVAATIAHGIDRILTFNDQDFRRFTMIQVMTPSTVLASPPSP